MSEKNKIDLRTIALKITEYNATVKNETDLRMGQFLFNELVKSGSDPEIFYEEDNKVAIMKFIERYGNFNTGHG